MRRPSPRDAGPDDGTAAGATRHDVPSDAGGSGDPVARPTRDRLVAAAMDLFGRQGFGRTTVTQIETAAGLSPGAGGMYRHFASKRGLLEAGLRQKMAEGRELLALIERPAQGTDLPLPELLLAVARAGLRRLEQERDVNRLLLRDLAQFPDLLAEFRQHELRRLFDALAAWLRGRTRDPNADVEAIAAVLIEAVSHYWVLTDIFGEHPLGIDDERYLTALSTMAAAVLEPPAT